MAKSMRLRAVCRLWLGPVLFAVAGAMHGEAVFTSTGAVISGDMAIDASRGVVRGTNLFHSFSVFNVLTGESAVFGGPNGIRNVVSRVTGGTSDITGLKSSLFDGPLSVTIPGANFFFINPNGVVIGENGSFSTSGSIFLSTADSLRLADGGVFFADPAKNSVLTTAEPVAFGFLSANPAPITLNGPRIGAPYSPAPVPPGKTFALVGGDIDFAAGANGGGAIVAPGATVSLASVASAGDALLGAGAVDLSAFAALGRIRISGASFIDVGDPGDGLGNFAGNGASGSIYIRGNQLTLLPAGLLAQTFGDADGGVIDIALRGDMVAGTDPASGVISAILAGTYGGLGKGAAINLQVGGKLAISDGSFAISESYGPAAAGDIHIRAGAIEIRGQGVNVFTGVSADNYDKAAGPSLSITTGSLQLLNGGFVGTRNYGAGTGGALSIEADAVLATGAIAPDTGRGVVTLSLSTETTGGAAGHLSIHTRTLALTNGARISSSTGGPGAAGDLDINASESVDITGGLSGIFTATAAGATGNAGTLRVSAPVLRMNGGVIDSTTVGDGNAGAVEVNAGSLQLAGGAQIRSFSGGFDENNAGALVVGSGNAGRVNVVVSGQASITGSAPGRPSGLLAETRGGGAGGDVSLQASVLQLTDGAAISSSSLGTGLAGNIAVRLTDSLDIQGGTIATAAGPFGNAGTLRVTAPVLRMNGGALDSTTVGDGNAGAVDVSVESLQMTAGAQIRSFSGGFDEARGGALVVGSGNAGRVHVVVSGDATITGSAPGRPSGLFAETRGSGAGGDVSLQASVLHLTESATISSSSLGSGLAGNIEIHLSDSLDMRGGIIATRALTSDGGNISIVAPRLIHLVDSQITTSVQSGAGGGGNIFIDPQFVILQNSQIIANAFGGPGGNISIVAGQLIADPLTAITASSALGIDGSVNIDAPDTDVSAGLAVLPVSFLDAASLLRAGCSGARAGLSSLVEVGRGGLPPDPDGYLPSLDLGALAHSGAVASRVNPLQRATVREPTLGMVAAFRIFGCGP